MSASDAAGPEGLAERLKEVRERLDAAAGGRSVRIVAVTKTFPLAVSEQARQVGLFDVGENYAQDLVDKFDRVDSGVVDVAAGAAAGGPSAPEEMRWHFIGGLQSNKIKLLADRVWLWQTIDRAKLIEGLASRVPGSRILIQVNATGESQKSGCDPKQVPELLELAADRGLDVRGLMTIGPTDGSDPRPAFALTRRLAEAHRLAEVSMGMSGDFERAAAEGATMVRLGSVLFGPRTPVA